MTEEAKVIDFADPEFQKRTAKATRLVTGFSLMQQIIDGSMAGGHGNSRLDSDPDAVARDLIEFVDWLGKDIQDAGGPLDWKASMRVDPIRAKDLLHLVDAPIPYILKPIIVEGSLTQIQGIPKGGKSAFSLLLSLCLSTGTWPQPQYLNGGADPVEVLYLAWEDPEIMMAKRLSLYAVGLGFERTFTSEHLTFLFAPDLFVERGDHEAALRAAIEELKPKVIFIDTLSHVHACDENSSSEMKMPMKALARVAKEMKVGIVYLHHTGKGSGEKIAQDKSRGSGAIAAAWHVLIDWGIREKGSNVNPVEVQSKYEHNWKNWQIAYELVKDDYGVESAVRWNFNDDSGDASREGKVDSRRSRIVETMKRLKPTFPEGWMTAQDLVEPCGLGVDSKTIKRYLQPLCEEGLVQFREGSNSKKGQTPNTYRISEGNLVL